MSFDEDPFSADTSEKIKVDWTGVSVLLAMPTHRPVPGETLDSMITTIDALASRGIRWSWQRLKNCSIVENARNILADTFLQSQHTKLFCLDSDMSWTAADFIRILSLSTHLDIVGASYPLKDDPIQFPLKMQDMARPKYNKYGCVDMEGMGMGFVCISRHVIEALSRSAPKVKYRHVDHPVAKVFRQEISDDGNEVGEDMGFFARCSKAGFRAWLDPHTNPGHCGEKVYRGSLAESLKGTQ